LIKVVLDALSLTEGDSGAKTRILELYTRIAAFADIDLTVLTHREAQITEPFERAGATVISYSTGAPAMVRGMKYLNRPAAFADKPGNFHIYAAETLPLPFLSHIPVVATIHDLRFLRKDLSSLARRLFSKLFLRNNLSRAKRLVVVSKAAFDQLAAYFPTFNKDLIVVAPNSGPPMAHTARRRRSSVLRRLGVKPPYILYIGHLEKRKNLKLLVKGFAAFCIKNRVPDNISLVLAGKAVKGYRASILEEKREGMDLHLLGRITEEEKAILLGSALTSVQPSIVEGFGMGVLESVVQGVATACSDIPAHREVAGKGAIYFSPDSVEEIAEALFKTAFNAETRARLVEEGKKRASCFSWNSSADIIAGLYRSILSESSE